MSDPFDARRSGGVNFAPPLHSSSVSAEPQPRAPQGAVPRTVAHEGGGIFDTYTPGPSLDAKREESSPVLKGYNFGPSGVPLPAQSPMPGMPGPPVYLPQHPTQPTVMDELGDFEHEMGHTLGLSIIGVAAGAAVGTYYGGPFGGLAGSLFAGAGLNAYRALRHYTSGADDSEAKISGTYAVISAAMGGALWYYFVNQKEDAPMKRNSSGSNKNNYREFSSNAPSDCNIRPVGP